MVLMETQSIIHHRRLFLLLARTACQKKHGEVNQDSSYTSIWQFIAIFVSYVVSKGGVCPVLGGKNLGFQSVLKICDIR